MAYTALLFISLGLLQETAADTLCSSVTNNPQEDLRFVSPDTRRYETQPYPPSRSVHREDQWLETTCCATGFDSITWHVNGTRVNPNDDSQYRITDSGQVLEWKSPTPGTTTLTCTLHKRDTQLRLSHQRELVILDICKKGLPWFTEPPEDQCADPGDDVTFSCEVSFSDDNNCTNPFFRKAYLGVRSGEVEQDFPHHFGMSRLSFDEIPSDSFSSRIKIIATIHNVTEDMYDFEYYCGPMGVSIVKSEPVKLVRGPCKSKLVEMTTTWRVDAELAAHIAIPVVIVFCLIILSTSVYMCKKQELSIWWNTHVRWNKAKCRYDAYLLHSDEYKDQLLVADSLCPQLEPHYTICLPERDFTLGSVIPEQTAESMRVSKRAIILLTDSLLTTDWLALSIAFAVKHCIPLIFIKHRLAEGDNTMHVPELDAAISVSTVLEYPGDSNEAQLHDFYSKLYQVMPLAKKPPQAYQLTDKELGEQKEKISETEQPDETLVV